MFVISHIMASKLLAEEERIRAVYRRPTCYVIRGYEKLGVTCTKHESTIEMEKARGEASKIIKQGRYYSQGTHSAFLLLLLQTRQLLSGTISHARLSTAETIHCHERRSIRSLAIPLNREKPGPLRDRCPLVNYDEIAGCVKVPDNTK